MPVSDAPPAAVAPPRIGIFDSGIGGLSVLPALRRHLRAAHVTYIADTRWTPWGERAPAWVAERCAQLATWLIADGAQLVLVACNTGTTQAIATLRARWPSLPFVGVEPGVKPAVVQSRNGRVAVLATTGTLQSPRMARLIEQHAGAASVLRLPCPGLADAIEQAALDPTGSDARLNAQLDEVAARLRRAAVDTVVLGCTHYPLAAAALQRRLGAAVTLVDTADAVARRVASLVAALPPSTAPGVAMPADGFDWRLLATDQPERLQRAAQRWIDPTCGAEVLELSDPPAVKPVDSVA